MKQNIGLKCFSDVEASIKILQEISQTNAVLFIVCLLNQLTLQKKSKNVFLVKFASQVKLFALLTVKFASQVKSFVSLTVKINFRRYKNDSED